MEKLLIKPEGPDYTIICDIMKKNIVGKKVKEIVINPRSRYRNNKFGFDILREDINNFEIKDCFTKGKRTYIKFNNKVRTIYAQSIPRSAMFTGYQSKDWCFYLQLEDDSILCYDNQDNYGEVRFMEEDTFENKMLLFSYDCLYDSYEKIFKEFKKDIKGEKCLANVLSLKKYFPGTGIALKSEILYDAKLFPYMKPSFLTDSQIESLLVSAEKITKLAYNSNGIVDKEYFKGQVIKQGFFEKCNVFYKKQDKLGNRVILSLRPEDINTIFFVKEVQGYDR